MLSLELKKLMLYLEKNEDLDFHDLNKEKLLKELKSIEKINFIKDEDIIFEGIVEEDKTGKGIKGVTYKSISSISLPKDRCPCCGRKIY